MLDGLLLHTLGIDPAVGVHLDPDAVHLHRHIAEIFPERNLPYLAATLSHDPRSFSLSTIAARLAACLRFRRTSTRWSSSVECRRWRCPITPRRGFLPNPAKRSNSKS